MENNEEEAFKRPPPENVQQHHTYLPREWWKAIIPSLPVSLYPRWTRFATQGRLLAAVKQAKRRRALKAIDESKFSVTAAEFVKDMEDFGTRLLREYTLKFWLYLLHKQTGLTPDELKGILGFAPVTTLDDIWNQPFPSSLLSVLKNVPKASMVQSKVSFNKAPAHVTADAKEFIKLCHVEPYDEVLFPDVHCYEEDELNTYFQRKLTYPVDDNFRDAYVSWVKGCERFKLMKDKSLASKIETHEYLYTQGTVGVVRPTADCVLHTGGGVGTRHLPENLATIQSVVVNAFWRASAALIPDKFMNKDELRVHVNSALEVVTAVMKEVLKSHDTFSQAVMAELSLSVKTTLTAYLKSKEQLLERCLQFVKERNTDFFLSYSGRLYGEAQPVTKQVFSHFCEVDLLETNLSLPEQLPKGSCSLVVVDPPFGLLKESWDDTAWRGEEIKTFVKNIEPLLADQVTIVVFVPYCAAYGGEECVSCVHTWKESLVDLEFTNPQILTMVKDDTAWAQGARLASDVQQSVLVMFRPSGDLTHFGFNKPEDHVLNANPVRFFIKPLSFSKYGRDELDKIVTKDSKTLNSTQKSYELCRWLVRHWGGKDGHLEGMVLSCCDGTGSVSVAALHEGRSVIALDKDVTQLQVAYNRVLKFFKNEERKLGVDLGQQGGEEEEGEGGASSMIDKIMEKLCSVAGASAYLAVDNKEQIFRQYLQLQEVSMLENVYLAKEPDELFASVLKTKWEDVKALLAKPAEMVDEGEDEV